VGRGTPDGGTEGPHALGHATTAFTMDVYGHVLKGEQQAAADRHGERMAAARERRRAVAAGK